MNTWALPAAAAAFWAGLLAWEVRPSWARPWMGIVVGLAGLAGAWLAAPRTASGHRSARRPRDSPSPGRAAVEVVSAPPGVGGSPLAAVALAMIGLVLLGAGWSGVHASWLDDSLLARLAPQRVTVVGTLHTDPEAGAFGWHATLDVTRVEWPGAAASLRASLWLSADDDPPPWVRGDVVTAERRDPPPRRSRVPGCARAQGDGRRAERERGRTHRAVSEPVHPCGTGVPGVRRPVDRPALPGEGGGVAARAGARRRLPAGPGDDARLPGERPRPSARRLRRERRDGAGADRRAGVAAAAHPVAAVRSGRRNGGLLRRDDRRGAVGDARGGDGHDRARGRADRQTARHRLGPGGRRPGAPGPGSVAGVVDRVPALGDGHRRHGGAGVADSASGSGASCRRRSRSRPEPRSPRSSA